MTHYLKPKEATTLLKVTPQRRYALMGTTGSRLVTLDSLIDLINGKANRNCPEFHEWPHLLTPEEVEKETGLQAETAKRLARRRKNPMPAILLTSKTIRFPRQLSLHWLMLQTRSRKASVQGAFESDCSSSNP